MEQSLHSLSDGESETEVTAKSECDSGWNSESSDDDSGEARIAEKRVQNTERYLSTQVDDSIWSRGPSRVQTWKSSAMFLAQPVRFNNIHLTPHVNKWYKDTLVIPHNAIKMELIDLYKIARSFEVYRNKKFIQLFLDLDEELVMKPVDSVIVLPGLLSPRNRVKERQAIADTFTIINSYRVQANILKDDDEAFPAFIQSCRILCSHVVNYIAEKEKLIPTQIYKHSSEAETMVMQDTMVMRMRTQKEDGEKLYLLYMRDLDLKTMNEWNKKYLKWVQRHVHVRTWRRRLRAQHYNLVEEIWREVGDPGNTYLPGSWENVQ